MKLNKYLFPIKKILGLRKQERNMIHYQLLYLSVKERAKQSRLIPDNILSHMFITARNVLICENIFWTKEYFTYLSKKSNFLLLCTTETFVNKMLLIRII